MSLARETVVAAISLETIDGDMIDTVSLVPANKGFPGGMSPDAAGATRLCGRLAG